jgi:hypothetical protein
MLATAAAATETAQPPALSSALFYHCSTDVGSAISSPPCKPLTLPLCHPYLARSCPFTTITTAKSKGFAQIHFGSYPLVRCHTFVRPKHLPQESKIFECGFVFCGVYRCSKVDVVVISSYTCICNIVSICSCSTRNTMYRGVNAPRFSAYIMV